MPSPFPGMDPYLEGPDWPDFHVTFITVLREQLSPQFQGRYVARVERRVYVDSTAEEPESEDVWIPDTAVVTAGSVGTITPLHTGVRIDPVECLIPMPVERREAFLVIRRPNTERVVTVLEVLSPANKRAGGDGRSAYLEKRSEILGTRTHLVELDLLRGGERLPLHGRVPRGDYYAIVSRARRRPRAQVYAWNLRDALPEIPIPLDRGDPDAQVDLQAALTTVYDRASYDVSLPYADVLQPPLSDADASWSAELTQATRDRQRAAK